MDVEFVTDCPNAECGNPEDHLYINLESGLCHCKRCDTGWNPVQLITLLHSQALDETTEAQYQYISDLRGISVDTLQAAGLAYDQIYDRWFVPYYSFDPKTKEWKENLVNLGIFYPANTRDPFVIHKGATLSFSLYNPGLHDEDADYKHIKIFEGEWDTLAYYDYRFTTDKTVPLGKPGAGFAKTAFKYLKEADRIDLLLDNDPSGLKQTFNVLKALADLQITADRYYLDWGMIENAPKDVRDLCIERPEEVYTLLNDSLIDVNTLDEGPSFAATSDDEQDPDYYIRDITVVPPVYSFEEYIKECRKARFDLSAKTQLSVLGLLAVPITTFINDVPVWLFLRGQPSSGKTTFVDTFGGENQMFDQLSKIESKSMVSGFRDSQGLQTSYLPLLQNKTLVVKDFTYTLMGSPDELKATMGLLTDIYDGRVKVHYGNAKINDFKRTYFNMIACVTPLIDSFSAANLGDRFLRIDWLGDDTDRTAITHSAIRSMQKGQGMDKQRLSQLTVGYINHLMSQTISQELSDQEVLALGHLAEFTATLRTQVVEDRYEGIIFKPEPEIGARVAKQFTNIYYGVRHMVGDTIALEVVRKVAFDTCKGFAFQVVKHILDQKAKYLSREEISNNLAIPSVRCYKVLTNLCTTEVLKKRTLQSDRKNGRPRIYYELNPALVPALNMDIDQYAATKENKKSNPPVKPRSNPARRLPPRRT